MNQIDQTIQKNSKKEYDFKRAKKLYNAYIQKSKTARDLAYDEGISLTMFYRIINKYQSKLLKAIEEVNESSGN